MISLLKSKFELFNRRVLFLSTDKMCVYHWEKGALSSSFLFDLHDVGRENFKRYLQESQNTPMTVLVDFIEEEFRQDTIPHVFGADRQALIDRKQSRLYRDASYFYTQNQGREEEGRRDDRLLFMALTNDEILKPWIALLEEFKVPIKGILSIPLLLQSYINTLPDISDNALIVTMQSISGLRQTFFQNHELKLSRLSKLPRYGTESYAPKIHSEIDKIQRYLNSLRLVTDGATLDVYLLADKHTLDELEKDKKSSPGVRSHYLDVEKLLESQAGLSAEPLPFCDQLLINHLLKTQPKNCYASSKEMRYMKTRNIRYIMNTISILLLISSITYSGLSFLGGLTSKQASLSFKSKADFYQARYDLAKERLPKTPVEPNAIKVAVDAAAVLNEYKSTPFEMLSFLGNALEKYPDIKLDEISWAFSLDPVNSPGASDNKTMITSPVNLSPGKKTFKYYQISDIKAHIEPFDGNYRDAISLVNKFAETLREYDVAYNVTIESFPLDISSSANLQGDAASVGKAALFSLRTVIGVN